MNKVLDSFLKSRAIGNLMVLYTLFCLTLHVFIWLNKCILRALLYSLERSFKHRGLTSGGVFGQASYEAKNLLCKYINCGSQVVFVTKKHLPPLPAHLDGCFFGKKNHNCAKNLDNKSFSFINVLTKYSTILSNACLIQANYLKVRVLFWKKKTTLTCNALKTTFPSRFFPVKIGLTELGSAD